MLVQTRPGYGDQRNVVLCVSYTDHLDIHDTNLAASGLPGDVHTPETSVMYDAGLPFVQETCEAKKDQTIP